MENIAFNKIIPRIFKTLVIILSLSGCMIGADYERPEQPTPDSFRVTFEQAKKLADSQWWVRFEDKGLNDLITAALQNNNDLLIASSVVDEFYARYGVSRSELFPQIGLGAGYSREKGSENIIPFQGSQPTDFSEERNFYSTALSLVWELDIWGRIRRSNEAARAEILAQEANKKAVYITVASSVANSYVSLLTLDRQLVITHETLKSREATLKIINDRFVAGVIPELDLKQVQSEVLTAKAAIPVIEQAIQQQENLLSLLLGQLPSRIERTCALSSFTSKLEVPAFLPSELLANRPDIMAAEERLKAAHARVSVARSYYFPSLSLTGQFGYSSIEFSNWIENPSQAWNFGPAVDLPIFTAGRISSEVEISKAQREAALQGYKKSILSAFREANDALIGFQKEREKYGFLKEQVEVLRRYLELATVRYDQGQTSYLEVLDAERRFFQSQLELTQAEKNVVLQYIEIYRSFGGGWGEPAPKP